MQRRPAFGYSPPPLFYCHARFAVRGNSALKLPRGGKVVAFGIFTYHPVARKAGCELRHARTHFHHPARWNTSRVALVKERDYFPLQQRIKRVCLGGIPFRFGVLPAVANCSSHLRRIGFGPPSVQLRKIESAINQQFHPAGSARFPEAAWGVYPQINAGQAQVPRVRSVLRARSGANIGSDSWHSNSSVCRIIKMPVSPSANLHGTRRILKSECLARVFRRNPLADVC